MRCKDWDLSLFLLAQVHVREPQGDVPKRNETTTPSGFKRVPWKKDGIWEDLGRCIFFLGRNGWCIDIVDVLMICLMFVGFQPWFASPRSKDVNFTTFSTDT